MRRRCDDQLGMEHLDVPSEYAPHGGQHRGQIDEVEELGITPEEVVLVHHVVRADAGFVAELGIRSVSNGEETPHLLGSECAGKVQVAVGLEACPLLRAEYVSHTCVVPRRVGDELRDGAMRRHSGSLAVASPATQLRQNSLFQAPWINMKSYTPCSSTQIGRAHV